jgi:hypothetical protein
MRTDVRPTGRADVRCLRDRCPRDRCDPGVRTDRRPVSAAAAAAPSAPRWIPRRRRCAGPAVWRTGLDVSLWSVSGLVVATRIGPGGDGMVERWPCVAGTRVDGRPGPPLGMRTGCGAALAAWPTRELVQRQDAGRLAGEQGRSRCSQIPAGAPWASCRLMPDHGLDREVVTTLRGRCAGGWSPVVRLWRAHPVQRGADCGRSAAAVCQERCPLGAVSALTSENSGGRDRV